MSPRSPPHTSGDGDCGGSPRQAALRIIRSTYDKDGNPFEVGTLISCDGQAKIHIHITPEKTSFNAIAQ